MNIESREWENFSNSLDKKNYPKGAKVLFSGTDNDSFINIIFEEDKDNIIIRKSSMLNEKENVLEKSLETERILGNPLKTCIFESVLFILFEHGDLYSFNLKFDNSTLIFISFVEIALSSSIYPFSSKFYTFGGLHLSSHTNQITEISLLSDQSEAAQLIFPSRISPPIRFKTGLVRIRNKLYLFGGLSKTSLLSDLWEYDLKNDKWTAIVAKNAHPSPRHSFGSASEGDIMIIWGGKTAQGYSNEFFVYNAITMMWKEILPKAGKVPKKRYGPCITIEYPEVYIFGGADELETFDGFWIFSFRTYLYTYNKRAVGGIYSSCFVKDKNFYSSWRGNPFISDSTEFVLTPYGSMIFENLGDLFFQIGGIIFGTFSNHIIFGKSRDFRNEQIDDLIYESAYAYYNKSIYYYGGLYITSPYRFLEYFPRAKFARIDLDLICKDNLYNATCSKGFYQLGTSCYLCPPGTYGNVEGSSSCKKCPKGHYNPLPGASSIMQCFPCTEGSFANKNGARLCKLCPIGFECTTGNTEPVLVPNNQLAGNSIQPGIFNDSSDKSPLVFLKVIGGLMVVFSIISAIVFPKMKNLIEKIDIFNNLHSNLEGEIISTRKTKIGGVFTIIFYSIFLLLAAEMTIVYFIGDIEEVKSLIPLIIIESFGKRIKSNFSIKIDIKSFPISCEGHPLLGNTNKMFFDNYALCSNDFSIITKDMKYKEYNYKCKYDSNNTCSILFTCIDCEPKVASTIEVKFNGLFGYSSGISVNFTSDSSIPNSPSSIFSTMKPEKNQILIGPESNMFYFSITPSYFDSSEGKTSFYKTGFHVSELYSPVHGGHQQVNDLYSASNFSVIVNLRKTSLGLLTERYKKQSKLELVGSLFGIFMGLMSAIGFFMKYFEFFSNKIIKHFEYVETNQDVRVKRMQLEMCFNRFWDTDRTNSHLRVHDNYRIDINNYIE